MDKQPLHTAYLLDDLESIHESLDEPRESPDEEGDIPLLSEVIGSTLERRETSAPIGGSRTSPALDAKLRREAALLLQEVVDDFVPQIEAELRRRLEARLDRLLDESRND